MLHLPSERLAALADEPPTADELAHLVLCGDCRRERAAYGSLQALATSQIAAEEIAAVPLTDWDGIAARLHEEGLITSVSASHAVAHSPSQYSVDAAAVIDISRARSSRRIASSRWLQAAAAALLVIGGIGAGRVSAGAPLVARGALDQLNRNDVAVATPPLPVTDSTAKFASPSEAMEVLEQAQHDYQRAATYLADQQESGTDANSSDMYRTRLAALDQMIAASRAALYQAPQDPVLNQYYLATYNAREATLKELGGALPVGTTMRRY